MSRRARARRDKRAPIPDFDDLVKLEQEKQIELGYEPNYRENVKKLQTL